MIGKRKMVFYNELIIYYETIPPCPLCKGGVASLKLSRIF